MFVVKLPIKNNFTTSKNFKIFLGSIGGPSFPFAYMGNNIASYGRTEAGSYIDIIETGNIGSGATENIQFTCVIPASSAAPYIIGVYPA